MTKWLMRSKRKKTGGLMRRTGKKEKHQRARDFLPSKIGEKVVRKKRTKGGGFKLITLSSNIANVIKNGKAQKAKILSVVENPADSHFVRRNIITKGAIIDTEIGRAVVTSRPGQDGVINAKIIEK